MRKNLITAIAATLSVAAATTPAWAAGRAAAAAGGSGHGASVSAAAMTARQGGLPVGPAVRMEARTNSQGPAHASANAITHVQASSQANANSVLGAGTPATSTTSTTAGTSGMSSGTQAQSSTVLKTAKARHSTKTKASVDGSIPQQ